MGVARPSRIAAVLAWTTVVLAWTVAGASALWARHPDSAMFLGIFPVFATVGAFVAARRPRHPVAWLLVSIGLVGVAAASTQGYVHRAITTGAELPGVTLAAWFGADFPWGIIWALFVVLLLVLPDGRPLSRPWAWLVGLLLLNAALIAAFGALTWPYRHDLLLHHGRDILELGILPSWYAVAGRVFLVLTLAMPVAVVGMILRFRRSRGVERQQMKWITLAAVPLILLALEPMLREYAGFETSVLSAAAGIAIAGIPITIGIAVLRYRLYEIDRIWNRAVVYALVVAILAATYVGLVLAMQSLLRPFMRTSDLSVAASTLAVAALFGPVRRRVQTIVDRRFNRSRYDAARTIEALGQRVRDEVDFDRLVVDFRAAVVTTVSPSTVAVWMPAKSESD